jgi:2-polyprenyl-3-methyl-5-hydroxy-6-metoxy-1,4-benzoquinol methylase
VTTEHAGTFDLIFSNNVFEHVRDVQAALATLGALLRPGRVMVHNCPNYDVPYEPHFGIPLLPLRPASTARVLPKSIT